MADDLIAPDEAAYYERRKAEARKPLLERFPRLPVAFVLAALFFAGVFAVTLWVLP